MPGVNDAPEQVERIVEAATEAGATYIGGQTLFLRGAVREIFFAWLREHRPDLVPRYEKLYAKGAYVSRGREAQDRAAPRARRGRCGPTRCASATGGRGARRRRRRDPRGSFKGACFEARAGAR